ncbi:MAG: FGGY family carbohydrate kinase [Actinobacteria bacterium]|nr:FGGY family carbohydrate kinase [Actinomycetota bacterium]
MSKKYFLGIDIGTTYLKVAIYNLDQSKKIAYSEKILKLQVDDVGNCFQEPEEFYDLTMQCIKDCILSSNLDPSLISGISIDGQMGGILAVDKNFRHVIKYDMVINHRSQKYNDLLNIENAKLIYEKVGCLSTYGGKILYWLNDRKTSKRIQKFVQPAGYVAGRLSRLKADDAFMDFTYLCWSGLADSKELTWSGDLCRKFGIDMVKLPKIVGPFDVIGYLDKEVARICNLKSGIPIAAGSGDGSATLLGAGINEPGKIALLLGTANTIIISTSGMHYISNLMFPNLYSVNKDLKFLQNYDLSGRSHFWFQEIFSENNNTSFSMLDENASQVPATSNKLLFIPYFEGILQPYKPYIKGAWVGLNLTHKKEHLYRSILESIAYSRYLDFLIIKSALEKEGYDFGEGIVIGGGAKSDVWNQIFADVFNIEFIRYRNEEFATLGSAIIAAKSINHIEDINKKLEGFTKIDKKFYPDSFRGENYRKFAHLFKELIEVLDDFYLRLNKL